MDRTPLQHDCRSNFTKYIINYARTAATFRCNNVHFQLVFCVSIFFSILSICLIILFMVATNEFMYSIIPYNDVG